MTTYIVNGFEVTCSYETAFANNWVYTREVLHAMTDEELSALLRECEENSCDGVWYDIYLNINDEQEARYYEAHRVEIEEDERRFYEFEKKHILGKSFNEIDPNAWDFYSDWHKDIYGFRPRW